MISYAGMIKDRQKNKTQATGMVVPNGQAFQFTKAAKSDELYGSDHFALTTVFTPQ